MKSISSVKTSLFFITIATVALLFVVLPAVALADEQSGATSASVDNYDPVVTDVAVVDQPNPGVILPGDEITMRGTYEDNTAGFDETHSSTWDWGDGQSSAAVCPAWECDVVAPPSEYEAAGTVYGVHSYDAPGSYDVTLSVNDSAGGSGSLIYTLDVVALTVDAGSDQTVDEGDAVNVSAPFDDPTGATNHSATIDWGDGTSGAGTVIGGASGTVSGSHIYGDNGSYIVSVVVATLTGGSGEDTLNVTVNNVAPVVSIDSLDQPTAIIILPGETLILSGSYADVGPDDTHSANSDWGDGTAHAVPVNANSPSGTVTDTHSYDQPGEYEIVLTVIDDDGASGVDKIKVKVIGPSEACAVIGSTIQNMLDNQFNSTPVDPIKEQLAGLLDEVTRMIGDSDYQGALDKLDGEIRSAIMDELSDSQNRDDILSMVDGLSGYIRSQIEPAPEPGDNSATESPSAAGSTLTHSISSLPNTGVNGRMLAVLAVSLLAIGMIAAAIGSRKKSPVR